MLRRIPATLLVYLVILLPTLFVAASWAATPDESMEILLKPSPTSNSPMSAVNEAKPRSSKRTRHVAAYGPNVAAVYPPAPAMAYAPGPAVYCGPSPAALFPLPPVSKVRGAAWAGFPCITDCILPAPNMSQWEMSAQVIFAALRGKVGFPNSWYGSYGYGGGFWSLLFYGYGYYSSDISFTDALGLPGHLPVLEFTARYNFRPNWAFRYSVLGFEATSGGSNNWYYTGYGMNAKWNHYYHRLGLVYDAIRNCKAKLSVFADWVHTDDTISANCANCGYYGQPKWGKNGDSMIAGLELQRCIRTFANGGTFSCDLSAGGIFLDNVEGSDLSAAGRYSIPLNCGRWGYVKGGYRLVDLKKGETNIYFNQALEGGFMEMGFIF